MQRCTQPRRSLHRSAQRETLPCLLLSLPAPTALRRRQPMHGSMAARLAAFLRGRDSLRTRSPPGLAPRPYGLTSPAPHARKHGCTAVCLLAGARRMEDSGASWSRSPPQRPDAAGTPCTEAWLYGWLPSCQRPYAAGKPQLCRPPPVRASNPHLACSPSCSAADPHYSPASCQSFGRPARPKCVLAAEPPARHAPVCSGVLGIRGGSAHRNPMGR